MMKKMTYPAKKALFSIHGSESGFALVTVLLMVSLMAVIGVTLNRTGGMQSTMFFNLNSGEEAYYTANAGIQHALFKLKLDPAMRGVILSDEPFGSGSYTVSVTDEITPMGTVLISSEGKADSAVRALQKRLVPPGTFTVYPPLIKDTFLDQQNSNLNYGSSAQVQIGLIDMAQRGVFEYDLSMIPSLATIDSASFELYMIGRHRTNETNNEINVNLHQILRSWSEGTKDGMICEIGATWNEYDCSNAWTAAGGDFKTAHETTAKIFFSDINQWHQWDVTTLVQDWVTGQYSNYGMLLRDQSENSGEVKNFTGYFCSEEYSDASLRPKLTVVYTTN